MTKIVVSSVEGLIQSSEKTIDFIDNTVIHDYQTMVNTGEQYYKDAESVQDIVSDFSVTSEDLHVSIQKILKSINELTLFNNEGAVGTEKIAEKAVKVKDKASNVKSLIEQTETNSKKLTDSVSRFKI